MATEGVLVNGKAYDHSTARLEVFGLKRRAFTSVDYSDKLEFGEGRGSSQVALAVSRGKYTADPVKITLERESGEELRQHIAAQSRTGNSLGQVQGTIVLQFVHPEKGTQTITMKKCQASVPGTGSTKEGSDALYEDWEFYTRLIDRNGITLYESDEAGAQ